MIEGRRKGREESTEKEGRNEGRTELEGGRREKRDRIGEIYPALCFPHVLKEISMEFLDQHLLSTLKGRRKGREERREKGREDGSRGWEKGEQG